MSYSQFSEAETRYHVIDPMLKKAGWNLADRIHIWFEILVQGYDVSSASESPTIVYIELMVKCGLLFKTKDQSRMNGLVNNSFYRT